MSVETAIDLRPSRNARRSAADRLREALCALAAEKAQVLRHSEQAWASITFSGARHTVELAFEGIEAAKAGERFIAELPDHEFAIPGQLVADAAIVSVDHTMLPDVRLVVKAELLLLQDA
ncbi:hypothetical protein [Allopontixanthobacter sp.]|uniref:hypothetical protein n=1 Tax=Allopontixanthobacter sp. TaxID=2906452 RepID=UPI002ABC972C|nr:hypothetical protein [Allopontixanthobacter sp.]MDZ4307728.1 hypothetical protein [Allopontixanthobacter sp.]